MNRSGKELAPKEIEFMTRLLNGNVIIQNDLSKVYAKRIREKLGLKSIESRYGSYILGTDETVTLDSIHNLSNRTI